jgi:hypothetical protein
MGTSITTKVFPRLARLNLLLLLHKLKINVVSIQQAKYFA